MKKGNVYRIVIGSLSIDDVLEDLGIARSTFYEWRVTNRGPKVKRLPNGAIRIRIADYEEWLASLDEDEGKEAA
ncbi:helix-turn-helix transcriptional regulator [Actinokineospora diospyrosa]|uniref:Transcriptional regulator, AlpA family n=1 Tax=Actinokineospora diospyrosa TaxID=103728 RepID=A0ABT1I6D6_9PSEU|nr:helix-turn-helix domain-containing protein [Actinokineospora diospyrosa]MCP2268187.1 transcriptional regulator, AlpA family [Actinokineospora diospyrosa]